jgi:hypothetical protein
MLDRRRRADLEGAQALGRLADEMVFSLGRAVREGDAGVTDADLAVFDRAAQLFECLVNEDDALPEHSNEMMFDSSGYLDALQVVQQHADGDQDVFEEYAHRLIALLREVIERRAVAGADEKLLLESLRDLFAEVGEATLSRAGELSLPQEQHWLTLRQAI